MDSPETRDASPCPPGDILRAAANADCTPEEERSVQEHLNHCEACRRRFDESTTPIEHLDELRRVHAECSSVDIDRLKESCFQQLPPQESQADRVPVFGSLWLAPPRDDRYVGRLGTYDVEALLGRGAMGMVLKCTDRALERPVALKVLAPEVAGDDVARKRFLREARAAAKLDHPHIVRILTIGEDEDLPYIVMEYVPGQSLASRIAEEGALETRQAVRLALQLLDALGEAHAAGLIHRDVKPGNVLLDQSGDRIKLADFGLARGVADAIRHTRVGMVVGTPQYMSPEQAKGEYHLDARTDLFSAGIVLFEMLTGKVPFTGPDGFQVIRSILRCEPPPPRRFNPSLPDRLSTIVLDALKLKPEERYQTAEGFVRDLRDWLAASESSAEIQVHPDRATCQIPQCGRSASIGETFVCHRCERRICRRHEDADLLDYCQECADRTRDKHFHEKIATLHLGRASDDTIRALAKITQTHPPFEARIWTEPGARLPTRDILTTDRNSRRCYRIGDKFSLNVHAERDCHLTLLDVGTSGAVRVLLHNYLLQGSRSVSLLGPDESREWLVGAPEGVECIKAFFTTEPLSLASASQQIAPDAPVRDVLTQLKSTGRELAQMPPESWTDASCEFVVEADR